jgi:hypothetical protein
MVQFSMKELGKISRGEGLSGLRIACKDGLSVWSFRGMDYLCGLRQTIRVKDDLRGLRIAFKDGLSVWSFRGMDYLCGLR